MKEKVNPKPPKGGSGESVVKSRIAQETRVELMLQYLDRLSVIPSADKNTRTMAVCNAIEAELSISKTQAKR